MTDLQQPSTGVTRETFLARIRASLEHASTQPPASPAPPVNEAVARLAGPDDDIVNLFADRAAKVGMQVRTVSADELTDAVAHLLTDRGLTSAVVGMSDARRREAIEAALAARSIDVFDWRSPDGFDRQYDIAAGITDVHAALAETGTLICCTDSEHSRGLSLLPPLHVAIVREVDILPDMIDYWQRMRGIPAVDLPSNINFITGPSKTADIEGELVTGVHGPEEVVILIVQDDR